MKAYIAWHRPGGTSLEVLREGEGETAFLMTPWAGSSTAKRLVLKGRIEERPLVSEDKMLADLVAIGGTEMAVHLAAVERAKEAIAEGFFSKVVLSRTMEVRTGELDLEAIVQAHAALHPNSFSWAVRHPDVGVWFGSTPEVLLQGRDSNYRTVSLAGTQQAGGDWAEKDRQEQQIVTDGLLESLEKCGAQRVDISEVRTVQVGDLEHLRTDVQFEASCSPEEVVATLHPTPAVGGYPREAALDFIGREEAHDRGFYTGWLGLKEDAGAEVSLFVNLRCASWADGVTTAFAGGGITCGSDPTNEWGETELKARSVLKAVQQLTRC